MVTKTNTELASIEDIQRRCRAAAERFEAVAGPARVDVVVSADLLLEAASLLRGYHQSLLVQALPEADNPNQTGADALARLNVARFGSLVKPDGRKLDGDNLPYLRTLRAELHRFSDAVLIELNHIERLAEKRDVSSGTPSEAA